jgi:hypothetical protein
MVLKLRPLWQCPKCGERFISKNMWHSCGRYSLQKLFAHSEPQVFKLFTKYAHMIRSCGPVRMIPQKTRIVFQGRVRFAGAVPRKSYLLCAVALPRRYDHPRFLKIESYAPHFHEHRFRVTTANDLDAEVQKWIQESYTVGQQKHVVTKRSPKKGGPKR